MLAELESTYISKNLDYGDCAAATFVKYGPVAYSVRISDKASRVDTLFKQAAHVNSESIQDTMKDSVNYLMMYLSDSLGETIFADNRVILESGPTVPELYAELLSKLEDTTTIDHIYARPLHAGELQLWYMIAINAIDGGSSPIGIRDTVMDVCLCILTYIVRSEEEVIPC